MPGRELCLLDGSLLEFKVNAQGLGPSEPPGFGIEWLLDENTCSVPLLSGDTGSAFSHFCLLPFASTCCLPSLMEVLVIAPACGPPPDPGGLVCHQLASRCLPRSFLRVRCLEPGPCVRMHIRAVHRPCLLHARRCACPCRACGGMSLWEEGAWALKFPSLKIEVWEPL